MTKLLQELFAAQAKLERAKLIVRAATGYVPVAFIDIDGPPIIYVGNEEDPGYYEEELGCNVVIVDCACFHQDGGGIREPVQVCDVMICGRSTGCSEQSMVFKALGCNNCGDPNEVSKLLKEGAGAENDSAEVWRVVNRLSRDDLESALRMAGIQSYESETNDQLREALVENILDGTLDLGDLLVIDPDAGVAT